jgi:O-antigen/teichoic acid export membrane protein
LRQTASTWTQRLQATSVLRPLAKPIGLILQKLQDRDGNGNAGRMALATFAIRVGGAALAYLSQIVLARMMGAHDYGIYSVVWTWVVIFGAMACGGFSSSTTRFIPQYIQTGDFDRLRGFLAASRGVALMLASMTAALAIAAVFLLRPHIESYYILPAVVVFLALPMFAFGGVLDGIARSYDWPGLAMLPTYILRPLAILSVLFLLVWLGEPATAMTAAIAAVIACWGVALYQNMKLNSRLKAKVPAGHRKTDLKYWFAISMPMLMVDGFLQLITSADVIMVSFWHDPDEVAVYFAASKTLALVHFVYFAIRAASAHRFSAYIHSNDKAGLKDFVRQTTIWTFLPSVAAGVGLLVIAPLLLSLFGKDFSAGFPLIAVLLLGVLARASIGPVDALLNMSGNQKSCAVIYGSTFAVNLILNFLLIPRLGLMGAALATSLSIMFEAVCLGVTARRKLDVQTFILPLLLKNREKTA